ncbi:MAG: flagellar motor protein MotA [Pseudomonadota bacterium]
MTRPTVYLIRMGLFLGAVLAVAAVLSFTLLDAFRANVGLNGVILLVLLFGIIHSFRNVASLRREITWIESFRRDQAAITSNISPRLLSPMATMLGEKAAGRFTLSTTAMRTLLDGIWSRLDERRELARYIIGLLVFLGLLGTFWGLLETVRSIGGVIAGLSVGGGSDLTAVFEELKAGLQAPLSGMGTAFSSSLFGLAGSLVVGFLELQAGQAQNRFYNDLEEWLSGLTRLSSGGIGTEGDASVPAYIQALLEKTADSLERLERIMSQSEGTRDSTDRHLQQVADKLDRLGDSPVLQSIDQTLTRMAQETSQGRNQFLEELRGEIRLLARTIAAVAGQSKQ